MNIERSTSKYEFRRAKQNVELARGEQALVCPRQIEHRTSNFEYRRAKMTKRGYDLEERLLEYSVRIIKIVEQLPKTRVGNHVARQLLRSGTSPYPNHGEAQAAESPKDFIHKLRISLKELRETQRWLKLIQRVPLIKNSNHLDDIQQETEELIKIFVASIKTAAKKKKK